VIAIAGNFNPVCSVHFALKFARRPFNDFGNLLAKSRQRKTAGKRAGRELDF
jgi:hypothetical protein